MEKLKEGLRWYFVQEEVKNEYFQAVEYEVIYQNQLDSFLPIQLRRQDDGNALLYDITGCITLEEASENNVDFSFCERLLQAIHRVLLVVEDYMLQVEHIPFSKNKIYVAKEQTIEFLYCPDENFRVEDEMEELFAWMLSRLNYEDKKGVEFVYYIYNDIRKSGISKKRIEEMLQKAEELKQVRKAKVLPKPMNEYKEKEFVEVKKRPERQPILHEKEKVTEKKIKQKIMVVGYGISIVWMLYFISMGWRYGYSSAICRYFVAGIVLFSICFFMQYQERKKEKPIKRKKKKGEGKRIVEEKMPLDFLEEETRVLSEKDMPDYWRQ